MIPQLIDSYAHSFQNYTLTPTQNSCYTLTLPFTNILNEKINVYIRKDYLNNCIEISYHNRYQTHIKKFIEGQGIHISNKILTLTTSETNFITDIHRFIGIIHLFSNHPRHQKIYNLLQKYIEPYNELDNNIEVFQKAIYYTTPFINKTTKENIQLKIEYPETTIIISNDNTSLRHQYNTYIETTNNNNINHHIESDETTLYIHTNENKFINDIHIFIKDLRML